MEDKLFYSSIPMTLEHDLTSKSIPKLIRQVSLPVMVGFFFNTMFNVVDTYYGGRISTDALAAMSFSFPVFFLIIIFDAGASTGITAVIANILGAKEMKLVHKYAAQSISFMLLISVFLTVLGLSVSPYLFQSLGAHGAVLTLALEYMNIILYGSTFFMLASVFNTLLQSAGNTRIYRNFLVVGFFLNVILDPWFLYGGFGLPTIGFQGIALATILIEFFGVLYLFWHVLRTDYVSRVVLRDFFPDLHIFREIARQAIPASLNLTTIGAGIFIITYFIGRFGENAVAAYGIATRVEQIALLPTIGLTIACLTIVGQNNGAQKFDRVRETFRLCLRYALTVMAAGGVLIFAFSGRIMEFFTTNAGVSAIGSHYLKIAVFIFLAYSILFIAVSLLQGMKRPLYPVFIGLYRQILAPVVVFPLLSNYFHLGIDGIWWGIFSVTWSAAIVTFWYARHILRRLEQV